MSTSAGTKRHRELIVKFSELVVRELNSDDPAKNGQEFFSRAKSFMGDDYNSLLGMSLRDITEAVTIRDLADIAGQINMV
jgi:hypothetical protein